MHSARWCRDGGNNIFRVRLTSRAFYRSRLRRRETDKKIKEKRMNIMYVRITDDDEPRARTQHQTAARPICMRLALGRRRRACTPGPTPRLLYYVTCA